jgi:hypothetical protein
MLRRSSRLMPLRARSKLPELSSAICPLTVDGIGVRDAGPPALAQALLDAR